MPPSFLGDYIEIFQYIESIGGKAVMTSDKHERASDRAAEAMLIIEKQAKKRIDILVMVQGDEPMDTPDMISQALEPIQKDPTVDVVNLMGPIESLEEFEDPNTPKVVVDQQNYALYFSREPVPRELHALQFIRFVIRFFDCTCIELMELHVR